jgi:hypothetical protein
MIRVDVYDARLEEWRFFSVLESKYKVTCAHPLHQFHPKHEVCACGMFKRDEKDDSA